MMVSLDEKLDSHLGISRSGGRRIEIAREDIGAPALLMREVRESSPLLSTLFERSKAADFGNFAGLSAGEGWDKGGQQCSLYSTKMAYTTPPTTRRTK